MGINDGIFCHGDKLRRVAVVRLDCDLIPSLTFEDLLPEFRYFLPVTDKFIVMAEIKEGWNVDIKNLALVDYQQPISEAVLPCINEWYRRHLEIAAQKAEY